MSRDGEVSPLVIAGRLHAMSPGVPDSERLLQRTDRLLAYICEVAQDAEALGTAERKQLADIARRVRGGAALTPAERTRIARYAYKALPRERISQIVKRLTQDPAPPAPKSRPRKLPPGRAK